MQNLRKNTATCHAHWFVYTTWPTFVNGVTCLRNHLLIWPRWRVTSGDHWTPPLCSVLLSSDPLTVRFCAHTLWIEHQMLSAAGDDCWLHELHYCRSNMRYSLLSVTIPPRICGRQKWQVISVFPRTPQRQVVWTTHMHLGGSKQRTWVVRCLQYFDTVGWVFLPVKTVSHITYTVLAGT